MFYEEGLHEAGMLAWTRKDCRDVFPSGGRFGKRVAPEDGLRTGGTVGRPVQAWGLEIPTPASLKPSLTLTNRGIPFPSLTLCSFTCKMEGGYMRLQRPRASLTCCHCNTQSHGRTCSRPQLPDNIKAA